MLEGYGPVMQAFLGTLFTWGLTAAGAALVIVIRGSQRKLLDASLGFAAGVMTAASFWSLLAPAIEMAKESKFYGENGQYAFVPVSIGFLLGALFVCGADALITILGVHSPNMMLALHSTISRREKREDDSGNLPVYAIETTAIDGFHECGNNIQYRGRGRPRMNDEIVHSNTYEDVSNIEEIQHGQWKRMMLLVIAITAHNVPEGLAVGVGFGAIGSTSSATFESARRPRDGRSNRTRNQKLKAKIRMLYDKKPTISSPDVARKISASQPNIQKIKRCGIITYKKKTPKPSMEQCNRAVKRSKLLYMLLEKNDSYLVIDDETYVEADSRYLPINQYLFPNFSNLDKSEKIGAVEKFLSRQASKAFLL
ncbi:hypothetical protein ILUMI_21369 [Ignelater luminosus]|uniref:Zinc transporter ZIP11 n=1 Tax=Ignelater luminosus TaxID=2038154 RepID=A0A8K0CHW6_IGNLU|nr:hypothetical protein ILUMI_21369 [Ignelater luminosus]